MLNVLNDGAEDERTFAVIMCTLKFEILVQAFEDVVEWVVNFKSLLVLIIYQFILINKNTKQLKSFPFCFLLSFLYIYWTVNQTRTEYRSYFVVFCGILLEKDVFKNSNHFLEITTNERQIIVGIFIYLHLFKAHSTFSTLYVSYW